jgi:hypothetical protein
MSLIPRALATMAIATAAAGALVLPASATQGSAPRLVVLLFDVLVGTDSAGTSQGVTIDSSEAATATNFKLEIDSSGLAGVATVTVASGGTGCTTSGAVLTCVSSEFRLEAGRQSIGPELAFQPVAGVAPGASGTWKATVSADGLAAVSAVAKAEISEEVDLAVPVRDLTVTSTPGGTLPQTLEIDNVGERAADGAVAVFVADYPWITAKEYSNCNFYDGSPVYCTFDEQLAARTGYATSEPVAFKLRTDTSAPGSTFLDVIWMTKAQFVLHKEKEIVYGRGDLLGRPGTGGRLGLTARQQDATATPQVAQTDPNVTNNVLQITAEVEGDNDSDLAAIGGAGSGAAGQVVTLQLGFENLGPASRNHERLGSGIGRLDITLPASSSLVEMPQRCYAMKSIGEHPEEDPNRGNLAARFIRCENDDVVLRVGTKVTFPVKLRIDQVVTNATGKVEMVTRDCDVCRPDNNPANDAAAVVLNGTLPATGVPTGLVAAGGALLAFGGVAVFMLGRRRKAKFAGSD